MQIEIRRPDDWHVHFRDHEHLAQTVQATAATFARALVMPNLLPPLTTVTAILAYRQRILHHLPPASSFQPFMTLYLTDQTTPETLIDLKKQACIVGAKLYPAHATTHAASGIQSIQALDPLFDLMQSLDLVLQIHGEDPSADIFEREASFIHTTLKPLVKRFPKLRIVLEHISTQEAVEFIKTSSEYVAATLTVHHLLYERNDLLSGGIKPHLYCLPILKHARDQAALLNAVFSGHPNFFAGTDSAPHAITHKESCCGCAGIYSANYAVALYAALFDAHHRLPLLNAFLSEYGAHFYQQPLNTQTLVLSKQPQTVPSSLPFGDAWVVPIKAGETISWSPHESP